MPTAEEIRYVIEHHSWFPAVVIFIFGACVGSFLNVVIYRLPKGESVFWPPSHNAQGQRIAWYDNLPILSWFILRGRDRQTGEPFSIRYAVVETLTALLFLGSWWCFHGQSIPLALVGMFFVALLIPAVFIDLDHMVLPDMLTVGGTIAGVLVAFAAPALHGAADPELPRLLTGLRSMSEAIIGVVVGSGVILWFMILAETFLRKEAMGFGDVVFMGCIGAFCGWEGAITAIFAGSFAGAVVVVPLMLWQMLFPKKSDRSASVDERNPSAPPPAPIREREPLALGTAIPFGPWLAVGALLYFFLLREPADAYFQELAQTLQHMPGVSEIRIQ